MSDERYAAWTAAVEREPPAPGDATAGPWRKVRGAARALLRRALRPAPERRATLSQLLQHRWLEPGECMPPSPQPLRPQRAMPASQVLGDSECARLGAARCLSTPPPPPAAARLLRAEPPRRRSHTAVLW